MVYGYARVSTTRQAVQGNSLEDQVAKLMEAGAQEIISDTYSGTTTERPNFSKLLDCLQTGDKLVITKLDRFARTAVEGGAIIKVLHERGVTVHVLNMGVADDTPMGKLMVSMLLAFAEFERDQIVERTQMGKAVARANGKRVDGRPKKFKPEQIEHAMELLEGHSFTEVERLTGISKSTLIRESRKRKAEAMMEQE